MSERGSGWKGKWMRMGEGEKEGGRKRRGPERTFYSFLQREGKRDRRDGRGTGEGESRRDGKGE